METVKLISVLENLKIACLALAGAFFIASVVIFFLMDIKKVIGDLTGLTAKKEIEKIRAQNVESGYKAYKPSPVNRARGKITSKITDSGKISEPKSVNTPFSTERIGSASDTFLLEPDDSTAPLNSESNSVGNQETTQIEQNGTTVLSMSDDQNEAPAFDQYAGQDETSILDQPAGQSETSILDPYAGQNETSILDQYAGQNETSPLNQYAGQNETSVLNQPAGQNETSVLDQYAGQNETSVLDQYAGQNETSVLNQPAGQNETTILDQYSGQNETAPLKNTTEDLSDRSYSDMQEESRRYSSEPAALIQEIIIVNTSEIISWEV